MEAIGKNLFAFFSTPTNDGTEDDAIVVHVHFGMSGAWAMFNTNAEEEPDVKPTTRLRLEEVTTKKKSSEKFVTHLSAMTVQMGDPSLYANKKAILGEDPLRDDADVDLLYSKVSKSKRSIAQLIMDQSFFAGPGNIYRAEILFMAGVYPTTLGMALDRPTFDRIWGVTVNLLRRGYDTGSILTVCSTTDPDVAKRGERRYIYNKSSCARCGGRVSSWDVSGRTCYACEGGCQSKIKMESSTATAVKKEGKVAKKTAVKKEVAKKQHAPFISHCAPITLHQRLAQGGAEHLTIAEIRSVIEEMDSDVPLPAKTARKSAHVEALNKLLNEKNKSAMPKKKVGRAKKNVPLPPPRVSAEDAALEKFISGENRAVEHVAELSSEQAIKAMSITPSPAKGGHKPSRSGGKRKNAGEKKSGSKKSASKRRLKYDA